MRHERLSSSLGTKWSAKLLHHQFNAPEELLRQELEAAHPEAVDCVQFFDSFQSPSMRVFPSLIVVGERETYFAKKSAKELAKRIQGAEGFEVPGVGHLWNLEKADMFNGMVLNFLRGQPLPPQLKRFQ